MAMKLYLIASNLLIWQTLLNPLEKLKIQKVYGSWHFIQLINAWKAYGLDQDNLIGSI